MFYQHRISTASASVQQQMQRHGCASGNTLRENPTWEAIYMPVACQVVESKQVQHGRRESSDSLTCSKTQMKQHNKQMKQHNNR